MLCHTLGSISVYRNHFFEMLLTLLERDWLSDKDSLSLVEEHIIVEAETIKQVQDTLIFPRGFNYSQVRVVGQDLLGRTYQGVLLRGEFLASLYKHENKIQATVSDILYFGFLDQNKTSVSLDFHYTDDEQSVFDTKSRQCSPLSLVEECRGLTLIGRKDHSVATQTLLCHKEPTRVFACSSLVLYGIRDRWLPCTIL